MGKFPQTQSNPITNMVAELNAILGYQYFYALYDSTNRTYELAQTEIGKQTKRFSYLATDRPYQFAEMFYYLNGILLGYRIAKEQHNL